MAEETQPILEFKDVSLRFGEKWALKNISLKLCPGETRMIYGQAGSGKTTLLKAVIGLVDIDEGEICLFGKNICSLSETEMYAIRSRAGFLFQEGGLFDSLTIGENVQYPLLNREEAEDKSKADKPSDPAEQETRVRNTLRFVELEHTFDQFPSEVSGGMRRRVGIARALVTEPPLVLYDSPTAGLDPITANTIMALIAKERDTRNSASLIVTHRDQDGELMSRFHYEAEREELEPIDGGGGGEARKDRTKFIVMKEGEIAFFGTRQELESSDDEYVKKFIRKET